MTIQEILEAHTGRTFDRDGMYVCQCGYYIGTNKGKTERHRAHVAEVLNKHMQEREAEAWDAGYEAHREDEEQDDEPDGCWHVNPYRTETTNGR